MRRKGSEEETIDFQMSEIFGLDWKKYSSKRMQYMIAFVNARNLRQNNDAKKARAKKITPRGHGRRH